MLGVETRWGGPLGTDVSEQLANMDTYIAQRVDGIIILPVDSAALTPTINRAVEADIPVVTFLSDSADSKRLCFVTSPLRESTHVGGEYLAKILGYEGKVAISYAVAGHDEQEDTKILSTNTLGWNSWYGRRPL